MLWKVDLVVKEGKEMSKMAVEIYEWATWSSIVRRVCVLNAD